MKFRLGYQFLNTPGPSPIPDRVLNAMHRQPYDLTDPELIDLTNRCFEDLKRVFRTTGEVFVYAANGHGGWEAALTNLFEPGERVLMPETGHFSNAWADHARALGIEVQSIAGSGRRALDPGEVEKALRADAKNSIKAVLIVQTDTAAGVTNDVRAMRAAIDAAGHPALLVVDAVASLGAVSLEMDQWGVDVVIAASQKALMGPPGLAFVAVNAKARAVASSIQRSQRYWNWDFRCGAESYRRFCGTSPEHGLFALRAGLDLIFEEGLDTMVARHARISGAVQAAVAAWSEAGALSFNAIVPAERAAAVTTILTPPHLNSEALRAHARMHCHVSIAGGLGTLSGKAFRIGHLGAVNEAMILGSLGGVELALSELNIPHGSHGLRAAVEFLARARAPALPVEVSDPPATTEAA